uniref:Uncharacterized protein n=1 Tax=Glossina palpalis gambiensis TaxID=67801 RepID=A0A1B0BBH4_9MUSC
MNVLQKEIKSRQISFATFTCMFYTFMCRAPIARGNRQLINITNRKEKIYKGDKADFTIKQVTELCHTISDYLKILERLGTRDREVSNPFGMESYISIHFQRLRNVRSNLRKADDAMKPHIKPEDLAKESEAIIDYDDKAITIIA